MPNDEIINYIKSEIARGENKQEIISSLVRVGWRDNDIQEAFNAISAPTFPPAEPSQPANKIITEKNYPITALWIFKTPIITVVISIVALFFGFWFSYLIYLIIALPILLIVNPLTRANFHYSTQEKFFVVKEGIISKKQRNLPYGFIQHVFVKQDVFDRIFGLASLQIENASHAGGGQKVRWWNKNYGSKSNVYGQQENVGSSGNRVNIPGLKKNSAEALKIILLQKMKENPIEDSQSGL